MALSHTELCIVTGIDRLLVEGFQRRVSEHKVVICNDGVGATERPCW